MTHTQHSVTWARYYLYQQIWSMRGTAYESPDIFFCPFPSDVTDTAGLEEKTAAVTRALTRGHVRGCVCM